MSKALEAAKLSEIHAELMAREWEGRNEKTGFQEDAVTLAETFGAILSKLSVNPVDNLPFDGNAVYTHAAFPDGSWSVIDPSEVLFFSR